MNIHTRTNVHVYNYIAEFSLNITCIKINVLWFSIMEITTDNCSKNKCTRRKSWYFDGYNYHVKTKRFVKRYNKVVA